MPESRTDSGLLEQLDLLLPASVPSGAGLVSRRDAIAAEMLQPLALVARERMKGDIVALFRDAEAAATAYGAFKESVKALAARWKQTDGAALGSASGETNGGARTNVRAAATGRVDHLGATTFIDKGWSLLSLGDAIAAETAFRRALELAPGSNEAESLLGWAQMMQENYDSALLTYHNVLLRDPQNGLARTNVGYICLRKKIYGEAIEHLSRAIRCNADRRAALYAHLYLGQVYYEREMYDDANLFFRKAIALGPNLLQAWYELGRSQWYAGQRDGAMEAWQAGAAANKFNPWGKRCAELVVSIGEGGTPPP